MPWDVPKWQVVINSTNSPALQKPSLCPDYKGCMIAAVLNYRYYTPSSLKFSTLLGR